MPGRTVLLLNAAARTTLCDLRDHGPKAYLRERAAVVLAVADGASLRHAARTAGLKPHHVETVWYWVSRYRRDGVVGLWMRKGRGRKPASFPRSVAAVADALGQLAHQAPATWGLAASYQTRWWLAGIRQAVDWLHGRSLATVCHTLRRAGIRYRRGRRAVHSPDPEYGAKVQRLATITWYTRQDPQRQVRLYQDELTYYRRPTVAAGYTVLATAKQPLAHQGLGSNTARRIAGCLDAASGRLVAWQRAHFDRHTLYRFYVAVEALYPQADQLFLIQDNWPVHQHRELVAALRGSKFTLVALPTYAPWLNPIEKVWRKRYAEVLHLHRWATAWETLQEAVEHWLDAYRDPSQATHDLLRSCGLLCSE